MLTPAQLATLKAAILADQSAAAYYNVGDLSGLADYLNTAASPAFVVWRTAVSRHEYTTQTGPTGTLFNWSGAGGYIARSQGERDAWDAIFNSTGTVNPAMPNVQAAFSDIFSGTGAGAVANRAHLAAVSKRPASRFEKLFATGTGNDASPATMVVEGPLSYQELIGL